MSLQALLAREYYMPLPSSPSFIVGKSQAKVLLVKGRDEVASLAIEV